MCFSATVSSKLEECSGIKMTAEYAGNRMGGILKRKTEEEDGDVYLPRCRSVDCSAVDKVVFVE